MLQKIQRLLDRCIVSHDKGMCCADHQKIRHAFEFGSLDSDFAVIRAGNPLREKQVDRALAGDNTQLEIGRAQK